MTRKSYTEEFREEAVRLVLEGGKSAYQVSKDIGVAQTTLSRWVRQHQKTGNASKSKTAVEEENDRLRRELAQVKMERDFLRNAAAYFAKQKQ